MGLLLLQVVDHSLVVVQVLINVAKIASTAGSRRTGWHEHRFGLWLGQTS